MNTHSLFTHESKVHRSLSKHTAAKALPVFKAKLQAPVPLSHTGDLHLSKLVHFSGYTHTPATHVSLVQRFPSLQT